MILSIDAAQKKHPEEWFGFWSIETGSWAYYDTKFSKAVKTPNSLIIIKNFNQAKGQVMCNLLTLMEGRGQKISVDPPYWTRKFSYRILPANTEWFYMCSKGVKFWLIGIQGTDPAILQHLRWNPLVEHME